MLTVTDAAYIHLAKVLDDANAPADAAVRLVAEDDAIKQKLDRIRSDDVSFEFAGKTILVLDDQMSRRLSNIILDMDYESTEPQLILLQT